MNLGSCALLLLAPALFAQWQVHTQGIPRTQEGKPDLTAKPPRTSDGKPDLSGLWSIQTEEYWYDIGAGLKPGGVPLQPTTAAVFKERRDNLGKDNPIARCLPAGVPTIDIIPTPFKIYQTRTAIAILYEYNMQYRQIFLDGRSLTKDPNPNWLGYSVGRWEGETLVVETTGLKDGTWLDLFGTPATDALKVSERFRRVDFGHMDMEITMTDPKAYTKPWTIAIHPTLQPDTELMEWSCVEGNKGAEHLVGK
jgi:hypothetical protein